MNELTLIRHGQAQTGATDEKSYDKLSELGHQQAGWLGAYLQDHHKPYDRIVSGALRRQIETAQSMDLGLPHSHDPRLNEIDYFGLSDALRTRIGIAPPSDQASFAAHIENILHHWSEDNLGDELESFSAFTSRIHAALQDAQNEGGRVLLVTSTGVIATLVSLALNLDRKHHARAFLQVAHTSKHKFTVAPTGMVLRQYGATPHLEAPDRAHAVTFI